jgi:homoserine dehydrogenase
MGVVKTGDAHKREIRVGILGLGIVGSGTVGILQENAAEISQRLGARLTVKKIAVRNLTIPRSMSLPNSSAASNPRTSMSCEPSATASTSSPPTRR